MADDQVMPPPASPEVEQFFEQEGPPAPQAAPAPAVEPPPPLAGTPPMAQPATPQRLEDLFDVDPELLAELHRRAKGKLSLGQIFALAGLAAVNPEMAAQARSAQESSKNSALAALVSLQQQSSIYGREAMKQGQMNARLEEQSKLAREKYEASLKQAAQMRNRQAINDARKEIETEGGQVPPSPTDPSDEKAVAAFLDAVQPLREQAQRKAAKGEAARKTIDQFIEMAKIGGTAPNLRGSVRAALGAQGLFTPEEIEQYVLASPQLEAIEKLSRARLDADISYTKAKRDQLVAMKAKTELEGQKIREALDAGDPRNAQVAARMWSNLYTERSQAVRSINELDNQMRGIYSSGTDQTEYGQRRLIELNQIRSGIANQIEATTDALNLHSSELMKNQYKVEFAQGYTGIFSSTLDKFIQSDGRFLSDPSLAMKTIASPLPSAEKDVFWTKLMGNVRIAYGDQLTPNDVILLLEEAAFDEAQRMGVAPAGPAGQAPQASEILSPRDEYKLWALAGKDAAASIEASRAQRQAMPPAANPLEPWYTRMARESGLMPGAGVPDWAVSGAPAPAPQAQPEEQPDE